MRLAHREGTALQLVGSALEQEHPGAGARGGPPRSSVSGGRPVQRGSPPTILGAPRASPAAPRGAARQPLARRAAQGQGESRAGPDPDPALRSPATPRRGNNFTPAPRGSLPPPPPSRAPAAAPGARPKWLPAAGGLPAPRPHSRSKTPRF